MTFDMMTSFTTVLLLMAIGEIVSKKTGAKVPSVFVTAVLFLIGYWTIFPKDIVDKSVLGMPLAQIAMYILVVHMGTLFNFSELKTQWKTILISLGGILGIIVSLLTVGRFFLEREFLIVSAPPLTGGLVAAIIMSETALAKGFESLSVLAIILYVMQGFVGYPITAIVLRKECQRLLKDYRNGNGTLVQVEATTRKKKLINFPESFNSIPFYLCKMGIVVILAIYSEKLSNGIMSKYVFCLIYGTIGAELGFLEDKILNKCESFGLFMVSLMIFIFSSLSKATPDLLLLILQPLIIVLFLATSGLIIVAILVGKHLGYSKEMSIAIAITAFYGFPANFVLSEEASEANGETKDEIAFLKQEIVPKMIVAGFTSVTIVSIVVAGILSKML